MKILVTGNLNGQLGVALDRVKEAVAKQGGFDLWLAMGDPMTPTMSLDDRGRLADLLDAGRVEGVQVAIFGLAATLQLGGDALAERLKKQRGPSLRMALPLETISIQDINILNISGQEKTNSLHTNRLSFTAEDLALLKTNDVSIVCTSEWPARITELSETAPAQGPSSENALLSSLSVAPRYWFSLGGSWEREPFSIGQSACRFIALASAGTVGRKWVMALQFDPKLPPVAKMTENPFEHSSSASLNYRFAVDPNAKRPVSFEDSGEPTPKRKQPPSGYVCRRCRSSEHYFNDCPHSGLICHGCRQPGHRVTECPDRLLEKDSGKKTVGVKSARQCWFCLNTEASQKHLIVAVGDKIYVTLAKGPLSPHHLLLIPIEHQTDAAGCEDELRLWREKISVGKHAIWWDTRHSPQHHWHQHVLLVDEPVKKDSFLRYAERVGFPLQEIGTEGLRFCLATEQFSLYHSIPSADAYFPANFGRQAILECLQLDSSSDWRQSVMTESQERQLAEDLKKYINSL